MPNVLVPVSPPLAGLLGNLLVTTLPGGPYLLPATLQPMLLIILNGKIRRELPDGADCRLPGLSPAQVPAAAEHPDRRPATLLHRSNDQPDRAVLADRQPGGQPASKHGGRPAGRLAGGRPALAGRSSAAALPEAGVE